MWGADVVDAINLARKLGLEVAEMQPFVASGRYVNYLDDDEVGDPVPSRR